MGTWGRIGYWAQSGEFIFIALMGGTSHVAAAFLGSAVFEVVRTYALEFAPNAWRIILGSVTCCHYLFLAERPVVFDAFLLSVKPWRARRWMQIERGKWHESHIAVTELNKSFGAVTAAANINVTINENEVVAIIGSNGAGKTTFGTW